MPSLVEKKSPRAPARNGRPAPELIFGDLWEYDPAPEFAVAETLDGGKPIKESRDFDVPMAAAHFFYHAGWADKLDYVAPGRRVKPLGVVGQVIPWNFPLLMLAWKLAPALAMGNCVVL